LSAFALLLGLVYAWLEALVTSGHAFIFGSVWRDWWELLGAAVSYGVALLLPSVLIWWLLIRVGCRQRFAEVGVVVAGGAPFVIAWGALLAAQAAASDALPFEQFPPLFVLPALLLFLGNLVATLLRSSPLFCAASAVACVTGLVALRVLSQTFLFDPSRGMLAASSAAIWTYLTAAAALLIVWAVRHRRWRWPVALMMTAGVGVLLPAALGLGHLLVSAVYEEPGSQTIFITCDALRADACSAYGGPVPTPSLEALADEGVLFEHCYSLAPWTVPALCGLFASKYPMSMTPGGGREQRAEMLAPRNDLASYWLDVDGRSHIERMGAEGIVTAAFIGNPLMANQHWLTRGFDHFVQLPHAVPEDRGPFWRFPAIHYVLGRLCPAICEERPVDLTRILTQHTVEFVRRYRRRPFFLWVHYMDPHDPYDPPDRFRTLSGDWNVFSPSDTQFGPIDFDTVYSGTLTEAQRRYVRSLYEGEIRYVDEAIGSVKRAVEAYAGDRTFLVVSSDHGEELWDHGGWGHGHTLYDELLRVPLIFWGPRLHPSRVAVPVSGADVLPTLAQLMVTRPQEAWRGVSLMPYLRGRRDAPPPRPCFSQGTSLSEEPLRCVVSDGRKLIQGMATGDVEYYDLESDPGETENQAPTDPTAPVPLRRLLDEWADTFPDSIADFGDAGLDEESRRQAAEQLRALGYL